MTSSPRPNVRHSVIFAPKANPCLVLHNIKRTLYLIVLPVSFHLAYPIYAHLFTAQCVCLCDLLVPHHILSSINTGPESSRLD